MYLKAKSHEPAAKTHDLDCEVKEGFLEEVTQALKSAGCTGMNQEAAGGGNSFRAEHTACAKAPHQGELLQA